MDPVLDDLRARLQETGIRRADLLDDPFAQFDAWFTLAGDSGVHEPHAMVLSTVDDRGVPSSRHVLLKGTDHGFVFYTNRESQKGHELDATKVAAACFPWNILARQVRVAGPVERVTDAESDEYFATRPRGSQVGAWASQQSRPLVDRGELETRWAELDAQFAGADVPRPPHWGGYRILPLEIEFWQGRPSRLHDRFRYSRPSIDSSQWTIERLNP